MSSIIAVGAFSMHVYWPRVHIYFRNLPWNWKADKM